MNAQELTDTAKKLVANDKILLAMDENNPNFNERFAKLCIPETSEARRAYREMIVAAPGRRLPSLGDAVSKARTCRKAATGSRGRVKGKK